MRLLRKILFWSHLVVGLAVGLFIASMAITGLTMTFERQIIAYAERGDGGPTANATQRMDVESLLAIARDVKPEETIAGITLSSDPDETAVISLGRNRQIQLNTYTGTVVGSEANKLRAFFRFTEEFHRWLAMTGDWKTRGRLATGAAGLGFMGLIVSGLYLWLPRHLRWNAFKAVLFFNWKLRGKARDWNWHNVMGLWLLLPLLVITTSGVVMSFDWANRLLFVAMGDTPPPPKQPATQPAPANRETTPTRKPTPPNLAGLNDLWEKAEAQAGEWTTIYMQLAASRGGAARPATTAPALKAATTQMAMRNPESRDGGQRQPQGVEFVITTGTNNSPLNRSKLTLNRRTGEVIKTENFASQTPGRQARSLVLPIHRGEIFGLQTQILAAISCCGAILLVYTGFALSWRRFFRKAKHVEMHDLDESSKNSRFRYVVGVKKCK